MELKYKRIILKLSGEVLAGDDANGVDDAVLMSVAERIQTLNAKGVQIGLVIGAGNFWRGRSSGAMERTTADYMGMLGTVMNALALYDGLKRLGVRARIFSAFPIPPLAEHYNREQVMAFLESGGVAIFAAGMGSPFVSTDTAAALRAAEIDADVILLAKNVDGVYDKDPARHSDARKYATLAYEEILEQKLTVMDFTAVTLCMDNAIPISVFDLSVPENILRACAGENVGTVIGGGVSL